MRDLLGTYGPRLAVRWPSLSGATATLFSTRSSVTKEVGDVTEDRDQNDWAWFEVTTGGRTTIFKLSDEAVGFAVVALPMRRTFASCPLGSISVIGSAA
jgi:hypothetical protein